MKIFKKNMKDYSKVWVTSDIHGYYNLFLELLDKIELTRDDLLIINGDSCDRGSSSLKIYKKVQTLIEEGFNIIHTFGNHEDLMVKAIENGEIYRWYRNGGRTTIDSYSKDYHILENHLKYIKSMPIAIDLEKFLIVHGGINPELDLEHQDEYEMVWIRDKFIKNKLKKTDKIVVYGHTPNLDGRITYPDIQKISIDCGSYATGILGGIELKSMSEIYVSTDQLNLFTNPHFK